MITVHDFVMLGKTVPEESKRSGRVMVCSAGYSPTLRKLIRVYPLARFDAPRMWSKNEVTLERNPDDSRDESFRLPNDRSPRAHERINRAFRHVGSVSETARTLLFHKSMFMSSIAEANSKLLSLAIIKPTDVRLEFDYNPESPESPELTLFDVDARPVRGSKRFPFIPRLRFHDDDGEHRLQLREWGVYELMRKRDYLVDMTDGERTRYVGGALRLDANCSLLVGNMSNQRTAWLVISILRGLRGQRGLFDELADAA